VSVHKNDRFSESASRGSWLALFVPQNPEGFCTEFSSKDPKSKRGDLFGKELSPISFKKGGATIFSRGAVG
jgi:hypothetical protein